MKVNFKTFFDKKTKETLGVELPDKTILMIDKKEKGFRIALPKKKFWDIFKKQNKTDSKYLEVMFSKEEIQIIMKAFEEYSEKVSKEKKE